MIATSWIDNPRDFMCRLRNGYKTVIDADWKKNITLIQIRCFNRKSLKTHLITDISCKKCNDYWKLNHVTGISVIINDSKIGRHLAETTYLMYSLYKTVIRIGCRWRRWVFSGCWWRRRASTWWGWWLKSFPVERKNSSPSLRHKISIINHSWIVW